MCQSCVLDGCLASLVSVHISSVHSYVEQQQALTQDQGPAQSECNVLNLTQPVANAIDTAWLTIA